VAEPPKDDRVMNTGRIADEYEKNTGKKFSPGYISAILKNRFVEPVGRDAKRLLFRYDQALPAIEAFRLQTRKNKIQAGLDGAETRKQRLEQFPEY